jgi:hypothetical protein
MSARPPFESWEARVQTTARQFHYPPTPPIAAAVRQRLAQPRHPRMQSIALRRMAWTLATLVIIMGALLAVPEVRAALSSFLRIGAIEVVLPTPTSEVPPNTPTPAVTPLTQTPTPTATTRPTLTPTPLMSVLDLAGETTLEDARTRVTFPIRLPAYPVQLGPPDRVFVQDLGSPAVILVWLDDDSPARAKLSLHILTKDMFGQKFAKERTVIEETTVNGAPAVWVRGPHLLQFYDRAGNINYDARRLVDGNVLIWQEGEQTYRLETELALDEAVRIAESLR